MGNGITRRNDPLGTVLVNPDGTFNKILKRCPHCGMVDYENMNQGIAHTHWRNWRVGGKSLFQCGKCRKMFYTLEVQIPIDMSAGELYETLNSAIDKKQE